MEYQNDPFMIITKLWNNQTIKRIISMFTNIIATTNIPILNLFYHVEWIIGVKQAEIIYYIYKKLLVYDSHKIKSILLY